MKHTYSFSTAGSNIERKSSTLIGLSRESPREPARGRFLGSFSPPMAWEPSALGPLVSTFDEPTLGFFKFPGSPLLPGVFPMGFLTPLSIDSSDDDDEDSENDELQQKQKQKHSSMPHLHHQYHCHSQWAS